MPSTQEVDKVKENISDLLIFLSNLNSQGNIIIQNNPGTATNNFQVGINLYTNALVSLQNPASKFLAATIAGYFILVPESLNITISSIPEAFNKIYDQAVVSLNSFQTNAEACWYNMCTGTIYTPNGFFIYNVTLNELSNAQFYKETDAEFNDKLNIALSALEESLKFSLK